MTQHEEAVSRLKEVLVQLLTVSRVSGNRSEVITYCIRDVRKVLAYLRLQAQEASAKVSTPRTAHDEKVHQEQLAGRS